MLKSHRSLTSFCKQLCFDIFNARRGTLSFPQIAMEFLTRQKRYLFSSLNFLAFENSSCFAGVRWLNNLTRPSSQPADKPIRVGFIWEACCRTSITLSFARRRKRLQITGFGPVLSYLVGTPCAMSMSDTTTAPMSSNNWSQTQDACV